MCRCLLFLLVVFLSGFSSYVRRFLSVWDPSRWLLCGRRALPCTLFLGGWGRFPGTGLWAAPLGPGYRTEEVESHPAEGVGSRDRSWQPRPKPPGASPLSGSAVGARAQMETRVGPRVSQAGAQAETSFPPLPCAGVDPSASCRWASPAVSCPPRQLPPSLACSTGSGTNTRVPSAASREAVF